MCWTCNVSEVSHVTCAVRVVHLEITGGKFPEIYFNLSGNLLITYVKAVSKFSIAR